MSLIQQKGWFRRLGFAAISVATLGTAAIATTAPAEAALRVYGGPGGVHLAIVQHPHHDWWRHPPGYYGPAYYGHGWGYHHGWYR